MGILWVCTWIYSGNTVDIKITYNGKEQTIENVEVGGQITVEYYTTDGEKMVYCLKITNKQRAVLN